MEEIVRTARTVEEAIELALKELDADRDEAEVEILNSCLLYTSDAADE